MHCLKWFYLADLKLVIRENQRETESGKAALSNDFSEVIDELIQAKQDLDLQKKKAAEEADRGRMMSNEAVSVMGFRKRVSVYVCE